MKSDLFFGKYCNRRRDATGPLYSVFEKRVKGVGIIISEASKCARHGTTHKMIVMLTVFCDVKGLLKVDFTDDVINSDYYIDLINEVRSLRRKPRNHDLYLLHDNTIVHKSNRT